jgi:hypothetical protein
LQRDEITDFVKEMKPRDHLIFVYRNREDKRYVLFTYLKAGLERGEAAAYVASEETPQQIRQVMQEYGIDVKSYEKSGALNVIDYKRWYIIGGGFDPEKTLDLWKNLLEESRKRGFKGLRVTGEMACFFDKEMVEELMEYERALHRTLEIPMTAICAYDAALLSRQATRLNAIDTFLNLLQAHSTAIIMEPLGGIVKTI